jgi:hypothetical protein
MDEPRGGNGARAPGQRRQQPQLRPRRAGATVRRREVERRRAAAHRQALIAGWLRSLTRQPGA